MSVIVWYVIINKLNILISTGVLGFDPEKNNHKLNFVYKLIWLYGTIYQNSPNFPPLLHRLNNTFQNGRYSVRAEFGFANISVLETHRNLVLVAIPIFSGSRNPIKQVKITLGILVCAAILNLKMAATIFRQKLFFSIYRYRKLIHLILVSFPIFVWVNELNESNNDSIG